MPKALTAEEFFTGRKGPVTAAQRRQFQDFARDQPDAFQQAHDTLLGKTSQSPQGGQGRVSLADLENGLKNGSIDRAEVFRVLQQQHNLDVNQAADVITKWTQQAIDAGQRGGGGPLAAPPLDGDFTAKQIEKDFNGGKGPLTERQAIIALNNLRPPIPQAEAVVRLWQSGGTGTTVSADPIPKPVPTPVTVSGDPIPTPIRIPVPPNGADGNGADGNGADGNGAPVKTILPTQGQAFPEQTGPDVRRRLQAEQFGDFLAPVGRRAVDRLTNRFFAQEPLTNFGQNQQDLSTAFQGFLANQPTQASLGQARQNIIAGGADNPFFIERFGEDPTGAFGASIQGALQGLTPRLRPGIESILTDQFANRRVQTPEAFLSPQQLFDLFSEFQGFGR